MKALKTDTIAVRITPDLKKDLQTMAELNDRTISNVVVMILKEYFNSKAKTKTYKQ